MRLPRHKPNWSLSQPIAWLGFSVLFFALGANADEQLAEPNATNPIPVISLRPAIQVDGEGVFLSQILDSKTETEMLRLGDAPAFGKTLLLKRAEVAELARAAGSTEVLTNWAGAISVRISRRSRALADKEALQLLSTVLQQQYVKDQGELELRFSRPWTVINIPDEPFTMKISELPTSGVSPAFIVRFEIETGHGERVGTWQASLQAKVWREIWVARSPIKRGELVRGADLVRERRDMLLCREAVAEFGADNSMLEFAEPLQMGSPLLARLIRPRAIVHRGQTLVATVQDGPLMITLKVEALEDGSAGQFIRVRNPLSRHDLRGKVVDEQNLLVTL